MAAAALTSPDGVAPTGMFASISGPPRGSRNFPVVMHSRPPALRGERERYAVRFASNNMTPRFEVGEVAIVDPQADTRPGDYVVVQLMEAADGMVSSVLVRRLVSQSSQEVVVEQFEPASTVAIPMKRIARMHRIFQPSALLPVQRMGEAA